MANIPGQGIMIPHPICYVSWPKQCQSKKEWKQGDNWKATKVKLENDDDGLKYSRSDEDEVKFKNSN